VLRRTLAVVVALAGSATLAAPASGVSVRDTVVAPLATSGYGPGYSPAVTQSDSVYPFHGDPRIDVLDYDLDLSWRPGNKTLRGVATLTLRAVQSSDSFTLDLSRRLTATAVQAGALPAATLSDVPFQADGNRLTVSQPLEAGSTYRLTVTYSGKPGPAKAPTSRVDMPYVGWHTTGKGGAWTMQEPYGAFTWYPVNDMPADKAMYTLRVDVPDTMVGISNGTMVRRHLGNRTITTFTNAHPMPSYLVTLAIGPYRKYTQTGPHDLPMTYWYPKGHSDLLSPMKRLPGVMTWLERKLGRYPFERVGVVVTPGSSSAMETPTMITLGRDNYRYGKRDVLETLMHELTHAWYGDTVTPTDWSDLWMNEGMAMFLESQYSVARGWKPWKHWRREFYRNDPYWRDLYGAPGAYKHGQFAQINVYYCTARMLDKLRRQVGNKTFYSLVKAWPQSHLDKSTDRDAYIRWVHRKTGKNLDAFFRTELDDVRPTL
jgi:aminopeptidase N